MTSRRGRAGSAASRATAAIRAPIAAREGETRSKGRQSQAGSSSASTSGPASAAAAAVEADGAGFAPGDEDQPFAPRRRGPFEEAGGEQGFGFGLHGRATTRHAWKRCIGFAAATPFSPAHGRGSPPERA